MSKTDRTGDVQYAALPYRIGQSGLTEVLLVTTRGTGRWMIPKGWPMAGRKPHTVASIEALQEGGVQGIVSHKALGAFSYSKYMPNGEFRLCTAVVFPLRVTIELARWREHAERTRRWFARDEAAGLVEEGSLAELISGFEVEAVKA